MVIEGVMDKPTTWPLTRAALVKSCPDLCEMADNFCVPRPSPMRKSVTAPDLQEVKQHTPQPLPHDESGILEQPRLASISSMVQLATWSDEEGCAGGQPILQVGDWLFHGDMKMLYDGSVSLSNSTVKMGNAIGAGGKEALVAVKSVALDTDAESIAMLRREADILRELGDDHPHILPMLYYAELPTELVLLTKYAPSGDLSGYLLPGQPVPELEVRRLVLQVLSALSHLHGRSLIHGDVKPQNIFLTEHEGGMLVQLSDFGLSRRVPNGQCSLKLSGVQGSYGFIPAEVIASCQLSYAADVFALGVMVFRYLGAHDPFYPPSKVTDELEFDESTWGLVSQLGKEFVTRVLSPVPKDRGQASVLLDSSPWLLAADAGEQPPSSSVHFLDLTGARAIWMDSVAEDAALKA